MSKPQLLKRKWNEDMTQNVRMARAKVCESRAVAGKRAKARDKHLALNAKAAKAAKVAAFGDA
eukprot:6287689-Prymnesium_polylepis.1